MSVEVVISDNFRREAKKYIKKFRSLKEELTFLSESLLNNPK
jgi:dynactin complex subunit